MVSEKVKIKNPTGLHLRPAGLFCKTAMQFDCSVHFKARNGEVTANAKSVLSVLSAQISTSREVDLICSGPDEEQAMEAMTAFLGEDLDKKPEEE